MERKYLGIFLCLEVHRKMPKLPMEEGDSPTERYTTENTFRILHSTQSEMFLWEKNVHFEIIFI